MKNPKVLSLTVLLALPYVFVAQDTVTGKVLDAITSEAIPGTSIFSADGKAATFSDVTGSFALSCNCSGDSLVVRSLGYAPKKVPCTSSILISLNPAANTIQEVVVTASREAQLRSEAPMAIDRINASMINDAKPTLLSELINKVPGVVMLNLNNEQHGMAIRQPVGTSPYYLFMEDGIPLRTMGAFNHNALIEMNLFAISSIEVVKGPASSLYGPEAVGGAMNFITQRPTAVTTAKAGIQADNFGYRRVQYGAGGRLTKKLGYYVGGYNAIQRNSWMTYSDYDKNSLNARLDYDLGSKTKIIIAGALNDYYSQTPGAVDSTAFYSRSYISPSQFTYRKVNSLRGRITLEQNWDKFNSTTVHFFMRKNSIEQNPAYAIKWTKGSAVAKGEINNNETKSTGVIAQHSVKVPALRSKLIAGISADHSPVNYGAHQLDLGATLRPDGQSVEQYQILAERTELLLSSYSAVILNSAAYVQAEVRPIEKLLMTFGGRYDDMRFNYSNYLDNSSGIKNFSQFSPKAGATFNFNRNAGIYANYSRGFSPPSLSSIFTRKSNGVDFYYDLEPAKFSSYETGGWMSLLKNRLDVNVTVYYMLGKNELINVRLADNSTEFRSAGSTLHQGVEYNLNYKIAEGCSFRVGGTFAKHQYKDFVLSDRNNELRNVNGNVMASAPACVINTEIIYRHLFIKGLKVGLEWQHMSGWFTNQANTKMYDDVGALGISGISVFNFRTSYSYRNFELFANVMNLSNELYAFNVTSGNSAGSQAAYTAAPPRTFVLGMQFNFSGKK